MLYFLAAAPIVLILGLMLVFRWGGHHAGPAGLFLGTIIALAAFGLTWNVFWVSQVRGLLLSFYVLLVLWPALMFYHTINQAGGIQAIALKLKSSIRHQGLLLVLMSWAFAGFLEGISGFGIPVAVVAPMLVGIGVSPVMAVSSVAVGHAWAVTMGNMGMVFQTLTAITGMDPAILAGPAALVLGLACILCGLGSALILGQKHLWSQVLLIGIFMAFIQYILAVGQLISLAAMAAGLAGLLAGWLFHRSRGVQSIPASIGSPSPLSGAVYSYAALIFLMILITLPGSINRSLAGIAWIPQFPAVETRTGFFTPAGPGTIFRFFLHPGTAILVITAVSYLAYRRFGLLPPGSLRTVLNKTVTSSANVSIGIAATVGLSTLMEHSGMTLNLAQGLASLMQASYPLVSPLVGMLGAFATGSNNNSNVLFASLQKNAALLLNLDPRWLLAAQTAGGSLGSMIAPAKIIVGCSTVGLFNRDGEVLRKTLPFGLVIGVLVGVAVFLVTRLF